MASFNKVILMGNVTRDPEVRYTTGGTAVCELTLAINHRWKDRDNQMREEVTFVDVTLWGRTAEIAGEYLAKGRAAHIEGRLKQERWEDKETKKNRSRIVVVAESLQLLGGKPDSAQSSRAAEQSGRAESRPLTAGEAIEAAEDCPF